MEKVTTHRNHEEKVIEFTEKIFTTVKFHKFRPRIEPFHYMASNDSGRHVIMSSADLRCQKEVRDKLEELTHIVMPRMKPEEYDQFRYDVMNTATPLIGYSDTDMDGLILQSYVPTK